MTTINSFCSSKLYIKTVYSYHAKTIYSCHIKMIFYDLNIISSICGRMHRDDTESNERVLKFNHNELTRREFRKNSPTLTSLLGSLELLQSYSRITTPTDNPNMTIGDVIRFHFDVMNDEQKRNYREGLEILGYDHVTSPLIALLGY